MLSEIIKHLDGSDALHDFVDAVVVVRLKMTRDMYLEEIERLGHTGELSEPQRQDYEDLFGDIMALERILNFYTGDQK